MLYCKIRLKLKKVRKNTRPNRYDLNQIPYSYTVEVRNRFKGLDLIDRVPEELQKEVLDIQEVVIKSILKKKKCKKAKWLSEEALQIADKRRLYTWTSPDGQYQKQTDYIFLQPKMKKPYTVSKNKTRS